MSPCKAQAIKQRTRIWDTLLHLQGDSVGINSSGSVYSVRLCFHRLVLTFLKAKSGTSHNTNDIIYILMNNEKRVNQ